MKKPSAIGIMMLTLVTVSLGKVSKTVNFTGGDQLTIVFDNIYEIDL